MVYAVRNIWLLICMLLAGSVMAADNEYRMGTGDVVRINVYGNPDLATEARVNEEGGITFPLIGTVKAAGLTPANIEKEIASRLAKGGFIVDPNVNLNIIQFRGQQISVLGRVGRPGKHALEKQSRVTDVLALAGGVVGDGADVVTLIRQNNDKTDYHEIDLIALFKPGGETSNMVVQDSDILNVARQPIFYIYGEVQRPGIFRLEQGMNVVQALSMAGGVSARGTQKGIRILRRDDKGVIQELEVKLADSVKKDDVIYVKESLF
ncbi:MAG: polysaccharide export protein EpsE [Thiobacillus sp.]